MKRLPPIVPEQPLDQEIHDNITAAYAAEESTDIVQNYVDGKNVQPSEDLADQLKVHAAILNYRRIVGRYHDLGKVFFSVDFFEVHLKPVVEHFVEQGRDFTDVAIDALDCIYALLIPTIRKVADHEIEVETIVDFFDIENGEFAKYYGNLGRAVTKSIAIFDGAHINTDSFLWEENPSDCVGPQHLEDLAEGSLGYFYPADSILLLNHTAPMAKVLSEHENPNLLNAYFRLVRGSPMIGPGAGDFTTPQFPIFDPEKAVPELEFLANNFGVVKSHITELARLLIRQGYAITFLPGKEEPGIINLHSYYTRMKETIPHSANELGHAICGAYPYEGQVHASHLKRCVEITLNHPAIAASYPGGTKGLHKMIKEMYPYIPHDLTIADCLIKTFAGEDALLPEGYKEVPIATLPDKNVAEFLEIGKGVTTHLRDKGIAYFTTAIKNPKLKKLIETSPAEFEIVIEEAKKFVFQFHVFGVVSKTECATKILEAYLEHWGHPEFDSFLSALDVLHQHAVRQLEETEKKYREAEQFSLESEIQTFAENFPLPEKLAAHDPQLESFGWNKVVSMHCILSNLRHQTMLTDDAKLLIEHVNNYARAKESGSLGWPGVFGPYALEGSHKLGGTEIVLQGENSEDTPILAADILAITYQLILRIRGIGLELDPIQSPIFEKDLERLDSQTHIIKKMAAVDGPIGDASKFVAAQAEQARKLGFWKDSLNLTHQGPTIIVPRKESLPPDSWLLNANPSTQMAATSAALIASLGLQETLKHSLPELRGYVPIEAVKPLPLEDTIENLAQGGRLCDILDAIQERNLGPELKRNMAQAMPLIADAIQTERLRLAGLFPIGAKTQTLKTVDPCDVRFVLDLAGLGNVRTTPFVLKHAGKSLVQPPLPSAFEVKMLHLLFQLFGVVDTKEPDIQVTMAGRWDNHIASIVGPSLILASYTDHKYPKGAWESASHDYFTGARMMLYDYGVLEKRLPFQFNGVEGRTDIGGRKDLIDLDWIQILGTFATHLQYDGPYALLMKKYGYAFLSLLKKIPIEDHTLFDTIRRAEWIYKNTKLDDAIEHHEAMIREIAEVGRTNPGIETMVRSLINSLLVAPLQQNNEAIRAANPDELEYLKRY
jgi:hypothetical protein